MKPKKIMPAAVLFLTLVLASCASSWEMFRKHEEALRNVGEAYMASLDYTSALREFLKAEKLYPWDPLLQNDLGLVYMAKNSLKAAEMNFKKALKLRRDYPDARNNLGSVYLAMKKWDAAIEVVEKAAYSLTYDTPHYPLSNLGWAYYNKGEHLKAERHYKRALNIAPDFVIALRDLGRTYIATGKMRKAVKILEKGVKAAPEYAEIYFYLGKACAGSGDYENALRNYRESVRLSPGSPCAEDAEREILKIEKTEN